jgi:hypothetical protein
MNGNHDEIRNWRRKTALAKTLRNRPDLLERVVLTAQDRELLAEIERTGGRDRTQTGREPVSTEKSTNKV